MATLRLRVTYPLTTTASLWWDHCPHARCRHSFSLHLTPFLFTGRCPSRGPSLATADANKNLDDVMGILCHGMLKHLSNSILEPHHIYSLLPFCNPIAFAFASFFPVMCYCITTVIYISCLTSQCSGKGALGSSRYIGSWGIFRDCISASMPRM
jgi:hypothetical protein